MVCGRESLQEGGKTVETFKRQSFQLPLTRSPAAAKVHKRLPLGAKGFNLNELSRRRQKQTRKITLLLKLTLTSLCEKQSAGQTGRENQHGEREAGRAGQREGGGGRGASN